MARRYDDHGPRVPKPYDFTAIPELRPEDRQSPREWGGHSQYAEDRISGHIEASLLVLTPLHVGAGHLQMRNSRQTPLVRAHVRIDDRPAIPTSTLKGVVRSVVEAISRSCVRVTRARPQQLPRGAAGCRDKEKLCPACRMFGSLGYQGLVRFSDAILRPEFSLRIARMPALYAPRSRTSRYIKGDRVAGRKFYKHGRTVIDATTPVEVCPVQAELDFRIDFDNLTKAEVGLLLTALGQCEPPFYLKMGGGKPACYGSVWVRPGLFQTWAGAKALYSSYDITESADTDTAPYLAAASELVEQDQLEFISRLLAYDIDNECPAGNY